MKNRKLEKMAECMNYFIDHEKWQDALIVAIDLYWEIKDYKKYQKELKPQLESIIEWIKGNIK